MAGRDSVARGLAASAKDLAAINASQLAEKANKDEILNGLTAKDGVKTWAQLQAMTTGNTVGDYYYCSDGDGTNPAGNYRWTGSAWSFGGTGDEGYSILKSELFEPGEKYIEPVSIFPSYKISINTQYNLGYGQPNSYHNIGIYKLNNGASYAFTGYANTGAYISYFLAEARLGDLAGNATIPEFMYDTNALSEVGARTFNYTADRDCYLYLQRDKSSQATYGDCVLCKNADVPKTNRIDTEIDLLNHWKSKKIVLLGTSVGYGQYSETCYIKEASKRLGFNFVNTSVPGQAIHTNSDGTVKDVGSTCLSISEYASQAITIADMPLAEGYNNYYRTWENIFKADNADADLWVYAVAPNNTNLENTTDWNLFDFTNWKYIDDSPFESHRTTFLGALLFLMDKMYALNPNARMVFLIDSEFNYGGSGWGAITAYALLKEKWRIPTINLWGKINTSPKSLIVLKAENGTNPHPSTFAHEIMGGMLAGEMGLIE